MFHTGAVDNLEPVESSCFCRRQPAASQKQLDGAAEVMGLSWGVRSRIVVWSSGKEEFERPQRAAFQRHHAFHKYTRKGLDAGVPHSF